MDNVKTTKNKISTFLNSHQTVISGTFWITFFTLSSKLFGFIKQILIGMFFGTSRGYDAVVIASGPSDFVAGIIAGAFAMIAIPLYLEEKAKNGDESAKKFARGLLGFTSIFLALFGLLLLVFPDFWIEIFAPGFSGQTVILAREYLRIFAILPLLTGWSSIFGTFLRGERKFFQSALAGFVISPVVIIGLLIFAPFMKEGGYVIALEMGTAATGFFSYLFGMKIWGKFPFGMLSNDKIKRSLYLASPLFISTAFGTISSLTDKGFASALPAGSVSALSYSWTIITVIYGLVTSGVLLSSLTSVSESAVVSDEVALRDKTRAMNEFFIKALAPITAFTIVAASWIVSVIYQRGAFNANSVEMTSVAVVGFSTMMITMAIDGALGNIYIAKKRTWRLTSLSLPFILLNAYMDWVLMGPFKQGGIAASSSIVSFAWMIVLLIDLKYKFKISKLFSAKTILPLITSSIYVWLFVSPLANLHSREKLALEILIATVMTLFFTRNEVRMILKRITRK